MVVGGTLSRPQPPGLLGTGFIPAAGSVLDCPRLPLGEAPKVLCPLPLRTPRPKGGEVNLVARSVNSHANRAVHPRSWQGVADEAYRGVRRGGATQPGTRRASE